MQKFHLCHVTSVCSLINACHSLRLPCTLVLLHREASMLPACPGTQPESHCIMWPSFPPRCRITAPVLPACSVCIAPTAQVHEQQASFHLKLNCGRGRSVGTCIWFWCPPPLLSVSCTLTLLQKHVLQRAGCIHLIFCVYEAIKTSPSARKPKAAWAARHPKINGQGIRKACSKAMLWSIVST